MSRSYKHTPVMKAGQRTTKRQANKIVRQRLKDVNYEIGNFMCYKTIVNSWDIADQRYYDPEDKKIYRK